MLNDAGIIGEIGFFFLFVCLFDKLDVKDLRRLYGFIIAALHVSSTWGVTGKAQCVRNRQYWDYRFRLLCSIKTACNGLAGDERTHAIMNADKPDCISRNHRQAVLA